MNTKKILLEHFFMRLWKWPTTGIRLNNPTMETATKSRNTAMFSHFAYLIDLFFISASDQLKEFSFAHLFVISKKIFTSYETGTRMLLLMLKRKSNVWSLDLRLIFQKTHLKKMQAHATEGNFFLVTAKRYTKKSFEKQFFEVEKKN